MHYLIIGLLGMAARLVDVPIGVLKLASLRKGKRKTAAVLAALETTVYVVAAAPVFQYSDVPVVLVFFALGVMFGTYLGTIIEDKLDNGSYKYTIITPRENWVVPDSIRQRGYTVTTIKSYGLEGVEKSLSWVVVPRKESKAFEAVIKELAPDAFVTVEELSATMQKTLLSGEGKSEGAKNE